MFIQDEFESENKISDILNPPRFIDNNNKISLKSFSNKNKLKGQKNINKTNSNFHKNIDNQRYNLEAEINSNQNCQNDDLYENKNKNCEDYNIKSNKNVQDNKNSPNNSLNKEENNFNYSDFKNKNDIEPDFTIFSRELKEVNKYEKVNPIKRPENKKMKVSSNNKEKLNQMLIEEENKNLNSSSENNLKNQLSNNELDACDEYLREHNNLEKSEGDCDVNESFNQNKNEKVSEDCSYKIYNEDIRDNNQKMINANLENQKDLKEENYNEFEECGNYDGEHDISYENINFRNDDDNYDEFVNEQIKEVK